MNLFPGNVLRYRGEALRIIVLNKNGEKEIMSLDGRSMSTWSDREHWPVTYEVVSENILSYIKKGGKIG